MFASPQGAELGTQGSRASRAPVPSASSFANVARARSSRSRSADSPRSCAARTSIDAPLSARSARTTPGGKNDRARGFYPTAHACHRDCHPLFHPHPRRPRRARRRRPVRFVRLRAGAPRRRGAPGRPAPRARRSPPRRPARAPGLPPSAPRDRRRATRGRGARASPARASGRVAPSMQGARAEDGRARVAPRRSVLAPRRSLLREALRAWAVGAFPNGRVYA